MLPSQNSSCPGLPDTRQALIDKIAQELEIHSTIEQEIFYRARSGLV